MRKRCRGYTFMEIVISLLISSTISIGAVAVIGSAYNAQNTMINQNAADSYGQAAINEAMDRIRGAQVNGANGPIALAAANQIQFYDYYDQYDRTKTHILVTITYSLVNGTLTRTITNGAATVTANIAPGVTSLQFFYRVSGSTTWNTTAAVPANVVAVSCTATIASNGLSRNITGTVQIRQKGAP